jgi:hypothetical protein
LSCNFAKVNVLISFGIKLNGCIEFKAFSLLNINLNQLVMGTIVKNKTGTGNLKCNCSSWLAHWERFSMQKAYKCSVIKCWRYYELVGAHVYQTDSANKEIYIVPLCVEHNKSEEELDIGTTLLIPSDVSKTCGK